MGVFYAAVVAVDAPPGRCFFLPRYAVDTRGVGVLLCVFVCGSRVSAFVCACERAYVRV